MTDRGLQRPDNQDSFVVRPDLGLFVVADGVGRSPAGALASALAVQEVERRIERAHRRDAPSRPTASAMRGRLATAFTCADARVFDAGRRDPQHGGMVTTLAAMVIAHDRVVIAHIGDSRIYRLRGRDIDRTRSRGWWNRTVLEQLTRDHTVAEDPAYRGRGLDRAELQKLTRVIGHGDVSHVPVRVETVEPEDTFLLCTDGVHGVFFDHQMEPPLRSPGGLRRAKDPEGRIALPDLQCRWLVDRAKQRGAPDNVTLVVVRFKKGRGQCPTVREIGSVVHARAPGPLPPAAVPPATRRSERDDED